MIVLIVLGILLGVTSLLVTLHLIQQRTTDSINSFLLTSKYAPYIWAIVFAAAFAALDFLNISFVAKIQYALIFAICSCIAVIDLSIRKIANELLIALLLVKISMIVLDFSMNSLYASLIGLGVGLIVYIIPIFLKINVGSGDIKLAAVIGFCLGTRGFLQAMIIMAIGILIYTAYIYIRKIGTLKSMAPMGPYLSLGFFLTLVFPLI